jgi:hypothetical protein
MYEVNESVSIVDVSVQNSERDVLPFYFFPVMHFPVLHLLEQSGWFVSSSVSLLLHTSEYFYWKHKRLYCFRDVNDHWLKDHCPDICQMIRDCTAVKPEVRVNPYFPDEKSKKVLDMHICMYMCIHVCICTYMYLLRGRRCTDRVGWADTQFSVFSSVCSVSVFSPISRAGCDRQHPAKGRQLVSLV